MQFAPIPSDETERLEAVHVLGVLDTPPEPRFDALTKAAVSRFDVPISTISILDKDREWNKSCQGLPTTQGPRDVSFCGHALMSNDLFIVEDTKQDARFADNPAVTSFPFVRFYAGMVLVERKTKKHVGVFCIKDTKPRKFTMEEIADFMKLARRAEDELNRS